MRQLNMISWLVILALLLAACGGGAAPAEEEAAPPAAEESAANESSSEETTADAAIADGEAPMLAEKVAAGELPPVDERLPADPLVIDLPWAEIGTYGGTLTRTTTDSDLNDTASYMYGHSPIHWTEGGSAVGPGLAKSWEHNEDASVWTFNFREGTKWSDGEPMTVDDFLFWYEDMAKNPAHPTVIPAWALVGGAPMEATKIDDYTLQMTFAGPAPLLEPELAAWVNGGTGGTGGVFDFYPRHYLEQFHPDYSDAADFEEFVEKMDWWNNVDRPVLNAWMPVQIEVGSRMVLERNPYYYAVDRNGNQLPYIDRMEVTFSENAEVLKLRIFNGDVNFHAHPHLSLRDLAVLKDNETNGDYRILLWDNGAGGAPAWGFNWNYPDEEKQEVIRTTQYRRALSHAIDRERIKTVTFLGLGEELSTGTMSPNSGQFNRTERGQELLVEWRESAVAFDPDLAMSLLDEINVTDQDGDGWRDLPSGAALEVALDFPAGNTAFIETAELMTEDWQNVGINAFVNTVPGEQLGVMTRSATYDIRLYGGGAPDGPDLLTYPQWLISYSSTGRWAPLYGAWMSIQGTDKQDTELDKDPRDRSPAWEEPAADDPHTLMWDLYQQAIKEPDLTKRDELVFQILQIHIDQGPFLLGGVADPPNIVIANNSILNVPTRDDIPGGGWLGPGVIGMPGALTYPEVYFFGE